MPNPRRRLLCLKLLVLLSIAGSLLSIYTTRQGWGEMYPFATWKLYTQPRGSNYVYSVFRVYTRQPGQTAFQRQPVRATPAFNQDDYVFMLESLGNSLVADTANQTNTQEKLFAFVRHIHPQASEYRVVQENMRVEDLLHHPEKYEADTVARF